ncbi:MAG: DUF853 family protein [Chloroflexi bacterium]|nr:DUF853 family protein [Chloroflexota bacterium]MDA1147360.1 DUF853 family protein [Chloroflexota bacterium]
MDRTPGSFRLGDFVSADGERSGSLHYPAADLTTHGVIVGMTGSGKTGLAVVMIEEALAAGVPVLVLDPKGDMPNLRLTFPEFAPSDFRPWINEGDAQRDGVPPDAFAAAQAEQWKNGLAGWGATGDDVRQLKNAAAVTIYTPGSTAGVPLSIVGDLAPPAANADPETTSAEVSAFVTGLLGLVGIEADPLASREHVLLSNLIEFAWREGRPIDLATLIGQTMDPPLRKLGVFEVDTFFPPNDRRALAMRLNALVASPTFGAWTEGASLDIQSLLYEPDGRPRCSIVYLAHLSEQERQFVVSLVLSKVITWMRAQSGTTDLRALLYMDEVFGFAPPTANPPAKAPILTLLKQARAYGVGFVLSTQNPVDLDYKAMSNAGTWMIGRLQTERDKARILEALQAASGDVDLDAIDRSISGLGKRQFVLHNTHDRGGPKLFTTRWAMSYLRGPLTREQIAELTADDPVRRGAAQPESRTPAAPALVAAAPAATPPSSRVPSPAPASTLAADETLVAPSTAKGVPVYYLDPAAPWARDLGIAAQGTRMAPAVVARVHLRFDDTKADVDHQEEWEAVLYPLTATTAAAEARAVDYEPRDLRTEAPVGATYLLGEAPIDEATFFRGLSTELKDALYRERSISVFRNPKLKLYSRVGETEEAFLQRCDDAGRKEADAAAAKLRDQFAKKVDRVRAAIDRADDRVEQLEVDKSSRRNHEVIAVAGDLLTNAGVLLGALFGGKKDTRQITTSAGRIAKGASSRRSTSSRTERRLKTAEDRLEEEQVKLEDLEAALLDELTELNDLWADHADAIEPVEIGLEKSDVTIDEIALLWVPVG